MQGFRVLGLHGLGSRVRVVLSGLVFRPWTSAHVHYVERAIIRCIAYMYTDRVFRVKRGDSMFAFGYLISGFSLVVPCSGFGLP